MVFNFYYNLCSIVRSFLSHFIYLNVNFIFLIFLFISVILTVTISFSEHLNFKYFSELLKFPGTLFLISGSDASSLNLYFGETFKNSSVIKSYTFNSVPIMHKYFPDSHNLAY